MVRQTARIKGIHLFAHALRLDRHMLSKMGLALSALRSAQRGPGGVVIMPAALRSRHLHKELGRPSHLTRCPTQLNTGRSCGPSSMSTCTNFRPGRPDRTGVAVGPWLLMPARSRWRASWHCHMWWLVW
jgi:hypothetical protein